MTTSVSFREQKHVHLHTRKNNDRKREREGEIPPNSACPYSNNRHRWYTNLVHETTNTLDGKSTSFSSNGVNHRLETHVDPTGSNHLCHIGRIVWFENSDGDSFLLEVSLGLGKEERSMVRGSFPVQVEEETEGGIS